MPDVRPIPSKLAADIVIANHYLHRRPPISFAYGYFVDDELLGVVTFGSPASPHMRRSVCPSDPTKVYELNRLWVDDSCPKNTESWFVSRAMKLLPSIIVVSYADTAHHHFGYIYRALNFKYAGWTDMDLGKPRFDYLPADPTKHSRNASRDGYVTKVRRSLKVRYWIATGDRRSKRTLEALCGWPSMDWHVTPPPAGHLL